MIIDLSTIPEDLNAKIEKVMASEKMSFQEAVIFLIQKVVSPRPVFVRA